MSAADRVMQYGPDFSKPSRVVEISKGTIIPVVVVTPKKEDTMSTTQEQQIIDAVHHILTKASATLTRAAAGAQLDVLADGLVTKRRAHGQRLTKAQAVSEVLKTPEGKRLYEVYVTRQAEGQPNELVTVPVAKRAPSPREKVWTQILDAVEAQIKLDLPLVHSERFGSGQVQVSPQLTREQHVAVFLATPKGKALYRQYVDASPIPPTETVSPAY